MNSPGSPLTGGLFQRALAEMLQSTGAERGAVLFCDQAGQTPTVRATHDLPVEGFWDSAPLSLELLRHVQATGESLAIADLAQAGRWSERLSLLLSDVRSLVCVPVWGGQDDCLGLLYVDWKAGPPERLPTVLAALQKVARNLERALEGGSSEPPPLDPDAQQRPLPVFRPTPYKTRAMRTFQSLDGAQQSVFFRALSTMFGAGIPLHRCFYILARHAEESASREAASELARRLERGQSLSEAAREIAIFSRTTCQLFGVGEQSGRLHVILALLADTEDSYLTQRRQLQGMLLYPLAVAAASVVFLGLAPGLLLSRQMALLTELNVALPWSTRLLMQVGGLIASPWAWMVGGLAGAAILRDARRRARLGMALERLLRRVPSAREVFVSLEMARFCQVLGLQLQAGLNLYDSLERAFRMFSPETSLGQVGPRVLQDVADGRELAVALEGTGLFPPMLLGMLRVGAETGKLVPALVHLARSFQDDFRYRIEVCLSLLEPALLMSLGIVTGVSLVLTMLPMVQAVQQL